MYIPWGCSGGECPAYAADISSAGWRNYWIQHAQATLNGASSPGYMGIFVDDVNLQSIYVSNGNGDLVTPMDPNTGALMTYDNWRKYFAEWMETVRAQIPAKYEIVHNTGKSTKVKLGQLLRDHLRISFETIVFGQQKSNTKNRFH